MLASPSNGISNSSKIRQKLLENRVEIARKRGIQRMMKKRDLLDFIEERKKLETYVQMVPLMLK